MKPTPANAVTFQESAVEFEKNLRAMLDKNAIAQSYKKLQLAFMAKGYMRWEALELAAIVFDVFTEILPDNSKDF